MTTEQSQLLDNLLQRREQYLAKSHELMDQWDQATDPAERAKLLGQATTYSIDADIEMAMYRHYQYQFTPKAN